MKKILGRLIIVAPAVIIQILWMNFLYNKLNSINYLIENGANLNHEDFLGNSAFSLAHDLKIKFLIEKFRNLEIQDK